MLDEKESSYSDANYKLILVMMIVNLKEEQKSQLKIMVK